MTTTTHIGNRFELASPDSTDHLIGQGGMGAVYQGTDTYTGRPVAIKLLKSELIARDPDMVHRFEREGEALRQLNHPNIVKTLGAFEQNGMHYLVMEYVKGGSLRGVLTETPRLSVQRAMYIALDLADALTRAHRLRILHRDIKPDNVLIADDGTPRLTDFGMARMGDSHITQDGAIVGTLAYLSPESFDGVEPSELTDIWAFGIMLYEMLAGERPYPHDQPGVLINAIMTHPVPELESMRPKLPAGLVDLIYRMLQKDPTARIPSVRLIGAELEAIIRGGNTAIQAVVSPDMDGRFENITPTPEPRNVPTSQFVAPNNLPGQPTPFIGRQQEKSDLQRMLESDARLITLVGPGGIGKTRIALEVATTQLNVFKDGVYHVPLATQDEKIEVVRAAIADSIDLTFTGTDPGRELTDYLREKQMLLVIDNFENLTSCSSLLSDILKSAPDVRMLVTSRERLRLRSEQIFEVSEMALPESDDMPAEDMRHSCAVQLFIQTAQRMVPDFDITDENAPYIARICRLVEGLPLGIELAAAWLEMLDVAEIAEEIENSLDFLETDLQDVPERQRSIRAIFEYSWNNLSDAEKEVFLKLSVFRGGFEREAARLVAGASLRHLTSLVNKSLLRREHTGRYFAHKLLKQYAEERMDDEVRQEAYKQHSWYYVQFLEKLQPAMNSDKEPAAFDAVDVELENLRTAWYRGIATRAWDDLTNSMVLVIRYYIARALLREGSEMLAALADALKDAGEADSYLYWKARTGEMSLKSYLGDYDEVITISQVAFDYFHSHDMPSGALMALNNIIYVYTMQGYYEQAQSLTITAEELVEQCEYPMMRYKTLMSVAYLDFLTGDYDTAEARYRALLDDAHQDQMPASTHADLKMKLGEVARVRGQLESARSFLKAAFEIYERHSNKRGMAYALNDLGGVIFMMGHYDEAPEYYQRAYDLYRQVGDRNGIAHALSALGNAATVQGDHATAKHYYEESLTIRKELGDQRGIADSLTDLARTTLATNDIEQAERYINDSIKIREQIGDRSGLGQAYGSRALAYVIMKDYDSALQDIEKADRIAREINSPLVNIMAATALGEYLYETGRYDDALKAYLRALHISNDIEIQAFTLVAISGVGGILMQRGELERAVILATLVQRYPAGFISIGYERADEIIKVAMQQMTPRQFSTISDQSRVLVPQNVIDDILLEFDL